MHFVFLLLSLKRAKISSASHNIAFAIRGVCREQANSAESFDSSNVLQFCTIQVRQALDLSP
jgi:hypothetical protein